MIDALRSPHERVSACYPLVLLQAPTHSHLSPLPPGKKASAQALNARTANSPLLDADGRPSQRRPRSEHEQATDQQSLRYQHLSAVELWERWWRREQARGRAKGLHGSRAVEKEERVV